MVSLSLLVLIGLWFLVHQIKIIKKKKDFGELIASFQIPIPIRSNLFFGLYSLVLAYELFKLNNWALDIDVIIMLVGCFLFIVKFYHFDRKQKFLILEEGFFTPNGHWVWGSGCWYWHEVNSYYTSGRKKQNFIIEVNDYMFGIPAVRMISISTKQIELVKALQEKLEEETDLNT